MKFKIILQDENTNKCYLCGRNSNFDKLDVHHVFGASNKKKSEKYGLLVLLHNKECHIFGKNSVHGNPKIGMKLKAEAQKAAMDRYGWTVEKFIEEFKKNYL